MGPLLRCWLGFCPSGIVVPNLLVSSLLRSFLTGAMLVSWSLRVILMVRYLGVKGFVVLLFQARCGGGVLCEGRVLGGFKRIRLNRKTPAHLARHGGLGGISSRPRVWKRLRIFEPHWCPLCGTDVLHECHHSDEGSSLDDRVGVG